MYLFFVQLLKRCVNSNTNKLYFGVLTTQNYRDLKNCSTEYIPANFKNSFKPGAFHEEDWQLCYRHVNKRWTATFLPLVLNFVGF